MHRRAVLQQHLDTEQEGKYPQNQRLYVMELPTVWQWCKTGFRCSVWCSGE